MLGRQLGIAIVATVLVAGTLTGLQETLCSKVASNPRALYLWAEYKMITGDRESASRLLQESTLKKMRVQNVAEHKEEAEMRTHTCSTTAVNFTTMMF